MLTDADSDMPLIRKKFRFRIRSLRQVLTGELSPVDRRLQMAQHRPILRLGAIPDQSASVQKDASPEKEEQEEESEENPNLPEVAEDVVIETDGPTKDEIRAANALAEEHAAEEVKLLPGNEVQVTQAAGGSFTKEVRDVLTQDLGETIASTTTQASVATMSTAAAEQQN